MNEKNAPGVYTQPDGDADDVLGHRASRAADAAPDFRGNLDKVADRAQAHDDDADDVEGHKR